MLEFVREISRRLARLAKRQSCRSVPAGDLRASHLCARRLRAGSARVARSSDARGMVERRSAKVCPARDETAIRTAGASRLLSLLPFLSPLPSVFSSHFPSRFTSSRSVDSLSGLILGRVPWSGPLVPAGDLRAAHPRARRLRASCARVARSSNERAMVERLSAKRRAARDETFAIRFPISFPLALYVVTLRRFTFGLILGGVP